MPTVPGRIRINAETFTVVDSPSLRVLRDWSLEVEGYDSASLYLTEGSRDDPAGRWRWRAEDNELRLEQADKAAWADAVKMLTLDWTLKKVTVNKAFLTERGYNVEQRIEEFIGRIEATERQIKYIALILADMGVELPDELLEAMDDPTLVYPPRR